MTVLLDITALAVLLLAVTFVPALWLRADRKITRQLRATGRAEIVRPSHRGPTHNI
jgi:hypothetical protein